jgi:hypothetical protein
MAINRAVFAEECAEQGLFFGVNTHFLVAVADILSNINDDSKDGRIGPFRITQAEWDANGKDAGLDVNLAPALINTWEMQCIYAGLMAFRAQEKLRKQLGRFPSADELYAEWPNVPPQPPKTTLQAALDATAGLIDPAVQARTGEAPDPSPVIKKGEAALPKDGPMPAGAGGALGELIASGEGDYNSFNRGVAGDAKGKKINFAMMTLADIMADQAKPKGDPNRLFAVGKYQVIPVTMRGARDALNLDTSRNFTPKVQEQIFRMFLIGSKRPLVKGFITGKSDKLIAAQLALAQEFASVADPNTGKSFFDKLAGNSSSITALQTAKALNAEKAAFAKLVAGGKSESDAWIALSPGLT